jgi:hypothetical protein
MPVVLVDPTADPDGHKHAKIAHANGYETIWCKKRNTSAV